MAASPNLWFRAIKKLQEHDRKLLGFNQPLGQIEAATGPLLRSLIAKFEQQQDLCDQRPTTFLFRGKRVLLRDVADKIIRWIHKFREIGDIAVSCDAAHAAIPWAAVRFVLSAVIANTDEKGHLLMSIECITKSIVYCEIYENACNHLASQDDSHEPHAAKLVDSFRDSIQKHYSTILEILLVFATRVSQRRATRVISAMSRPDRVPLLITRLEDEVAKLSDIYQITSVTERRQLEGLKEPLRRSMQVQQHTFKILERGEFFRLLDWCSDPQHASYHGPIKRKRAENTGGWLRAHPSFTAWQESSSSGLLLLHGDPGVGKTVLVSGLVDWSEERCRAARTSSPGATGEVFAFFYCNRSEATRRSASNIFRAFVRQTTAALYKDNAVFGVLSKLEATWVECQLSSHSLDIATCRDLLLEAIASRPLTTLYLDALDECEKHERSNILSELKTLVNSAAHPLKVLISSRPSPDILEAFQHHEQLKIEVCNNADDISTYINQQMDSVWARRMQLKGRKRVKDILMEKSKGMFQWVALQMSRLSELEIWSQEIVERTVQSMPVGLDALYNQMFENVISRSRPETDRAFAIRALSWVLIADRPLQREWLLNMICVDPDTEVLDQRPEGLDEATLLTICENFLVLDQEHDVWRFCHLSAQDFMEAGPKATLDAAELVAKVTLKLLLMRHRQHSSQMRLSLLHGASPLPSDSEGYVFDSWPMLIYPARQQFVSPLLQDRLRAFFSISQDLVQWRPDFDEMMPCRFWSCAQERIKSTKPKSRVKQMRLYAKYLRLPRPYQIIAGTCIFGCRSLLSYCLEGGQRDAYWFMVENNIPSSLAIALFFGHEEVCLDILHYDSLFTANTSRQSSVTTNGFRQLSVGRNASRELSIASEMGMVRVLERLLSRGADPNRLAKRPTHLVQSDSVLNSCISFNTRAPLIDAAVYGSEKGSGISCAMLEKLLEAGADIEVTLEDATCHFKLGDDEVPFKMNALSLAILKGACEVVDFLIRNGAKLPTPMEARTIGHLLARTRGLPHEMIFHIPNYEIGPEEVDYCFMQLCGVSEWGDTVQALIAKGANINGRAGRKSLLVSIINRCREESAVISIIDGLINLGLDVNMVLPEDVGTALGAAARNASLPIVNHLLRRGANPNVPGGTLSPLAAISHSSDLDCQQVLERLLEAGADVNYISDRSKFPTALDRALHSDASCNCAVILLEKGADLAVCSSQNGTPLQRATRSGRSALTQKLLAAGADIHETSASDKRTPLHIAVREKRKDIAQILLDAGACVF